MRAWGALVGEPIFIGLAIAVSSWGEKVNCRYIIKLRSYHDLRHFIDQHNLHGLTMHKLHKFPAIPASLKKTLLLVLWFKK